MEKYFMYVIIINRKKGDVKMKRIIMVLIALITLISACGSKEKSSEEISGTITVVTNFTNKDEEFERIEKLFIEKYPNVEDIIWENIGGDYDEHITSRMTTGNYGDVLIVPFSLKNNPVELENFLLPIGTTEEVEKKYHFAEIASYNSNTYALPISLNTLGILYNENVFEEAGIENIPTSSEEMYAASKLIKENTGAIPWYTNLNTLPMFWSGAVTSYGGESYMGNILDAGTLVEEGQPYREIYDFIYTMITSGYTESDPVTGDLMQSMQLVADGEVGFIIMGSQELKNIMDMSATPDKIKMAPLPVTFENKQSMPVGPDALLGISKNTENEATARAFYEFLLSPESGFAVSNVGFSPEIGSEDKVPEYLSYQLMEYPSIRTIPTETDEVKTEFLEVGRNASMPSITDSVLDLAVIATNDKDYQEWLNEIEAAWQKALGENER